VLYPEIRRLVDGGDDLANEAEAEHAAAKLLIARVYETPPADLHDLIDELRTAIEIHVASEENALFPKLRDAGVDAEALGRKLDAARGEATSRSSGQVG
jgi:iron-sulfur cluster repair protein YtfE (RIC family)